MHTIKDGCLEAFLTLEKIKEIIFSFEGNVDVIATKNSILELNYDNKILICDNKHKLINEKFLKQFETIESLELWVRVENILLDNDIILVGDLMRKTPGEIISFNGIGLRYINGLTEVMKHRGICFGYIFSEKENEIYNSVRSYVIKQL